MFNWNDRLMTHFSCLNVQMRDAPLVTYHNLRNGLRWKGFPSLSRVKGCDPTDFFFL